MIAYIGIDDHDSPIGGCTTHFTTIFIKKLLQKQNIQIIDFPYLVRLNPNIPWKTRGNAALMIKINVPESIDLKDLLEFAWNESTEYVNSISKGYLYNRKPGIVILTEEQREKLKWFYFKALFQVVPISIFNEIIDKFKILNKGTRGRIGALAAVTFNGDITYELLTYRKRENWKKRRNINLEILKEIDDRYFPKVFANVDYIKRIPLIISHGKDPVLYGIRAIEAYLLYEIFAKYHSLLTEEEIDCFMIFKSNQATDKHIITAEGKYPYQTIDKIYTVKSREILKGGDVKVIATDGSQIYFFKETGELNKAAKFLSMNDRIRVIGTLKPSNENNVIIEAERMSVIYLQPLIKYTNPKCPKCGGSTESVGKNKGFRCKKCGFVFHGSKIAKEIPRELSLGIYQSRQYRHLSKPLFIRPVKNLQAPSDLLKEILDKMRNTCYNY